MGVFLIAAKPYLTPNLIVQLCLLLIILGLPMSALGYRSFSAAPGIEVLSGSRQRSVMSTVSGLLLIAVGVVGLMMRHSLAAEKGTYAAVILILLGSLLLMPILAGFLTRLLARTTRGWLPIESRLAVDNLVRSPGRTGLVIAALAAGVAMTVQTAGMIRSNEVAFREWLDTAVKADLLLASGGAVTANGQPRPLPPKLADEVFKLNLLPPGTRLVGECHRYPPWNQSNRPSGPSLPGDRRDETLIFLTLIDATDHYRANRERGNAGEELELWRRLGEEPGTVIVSDNFARMHGVAVGDIIQLPGKGGSVHLRVIGVIVDYNWIRGSIWIDRPRYREAFGAEDANLWDVYLPLEARDRAGEIRDELQKSPLGAQHALLGMTRDEFRDGTLRMIARVYGVAYTQELLVGIVVILGVVTALLISVLSRQRELGLLRAVGATRPQVVHTVLAEGIFIGVVGTVLGIAIGLPLEWYAVRIILFEEAGFLFPVRIPWLETAVITGLAVLSATLAGLAPALKAVRLRISDAIAYE
jgi:putative ABC transport system permease protein